MKLSDVMGASGLQVFAEVGLLLFIALFAGVVIYLLARRNQSTFERVRSLPLDDDGARAQEMPTDERR